MCLLFVTYTVYVLNAYQFILAGTSCRNCKKIVWPGNRRYLSPSDPLREDGDFIDSELQQQPEKNSMAELVNYRKAYDNAERAVDREQVSSASGCKASYSFMHLSYHDFMVDVQPDGMHTVSNVIKTLIKLLSNLYQIAMTSVLEDEKKFKSLERCSYIVSALTDQEGTTTTKSKKSFKKPCKAQFLPYVLSKEAIVIANARANSICTPPEFGFKCCNVFSGTYMKSHDWMEASELRSSIKILYEL